MIETVKRNGDLLLASISKDVEELRCCCCACYFSENSIRLSDQRKIIKNIRKRHNKAKRHDEKQKRGEKEAK
jgi:hypothetical protein